MCRLFPEVYEGLDPGCCLVAELDGQLAGSCFYHPRETHVSVGIVNVDARSAGHGVARKLMEEVIKRSEGRPIRLVSSAMNLDSYSLYTRCGFTPTTLYQDMVFKAGNDVSALLSKSTTTARDARMEDVAAMVELEEKINGIRREKDFRYFIENQLGIWHGSVVEQDGVLTGFLFSVNHPSSQILGPGVMESTDVALTLIAAETKRFDDGNPLMLIPAKQKDLVAALYTAGARNCEMHVAQVYGDWQEPTGIVLPTFMPETG